MGLADSAAVSADRELSCQDAGHDLKPSFLPAAVGPLEPVRLVCEQCGRIWDVADGRGGVEPAAPISNPSPARRAVLRLLGRC